MDLPIYALEEPPKAYLGVQLCIELTLRGGKHRHECIKLLQHTLTLEPGNLAARTLLGIAFSEDAALRKIMKPQELFQEAAHQGDAHAQFCLAYSFLHGDGVPQDMLKAVEWFRKSSEGGFGVAQYELGCLLL